jgi:hypothetical protein
MCLTSKVLGCSLGMVLGKDVEIKVPRMAVGISVDETKQKAFKKKWKKNNYK